ncbi:transcription factor EMB1444 isoform X2 [Punica granatum]|uniref:Transcription factor EMB1444 isoform X2 n=1 Tax=Punica granatum TaxID=22663 RepID=A0A6P8BS69_PUNGR|nr:transcription factor EMB1444 isoform X2 [Punica granatum]
MTTGLQRLLRSLCSGTEWTYAVFWRLKPHRRMVLTWDDAYYDNCGKAELSEVNCSTEVVDHFESLRTSQDPLGLALAKLSYYGYSLGEGIIGEVAVTGKHKWISFDDYVKNSHSSFKFQDFDAWQAQFLAGIKTVLIVAVPHGVVQLGSLQKIDEDMKLVTHIRDVFHSLQDDSLQHQSSCMPCGVDSLWHKPNLSMQALLSEVCLDNESNLDKAPYGGHSNDCSSMLPYSEKHIRGSTTFRECRFSPNAAVEGFNDYDEPKDSNHHQDSQLVEAISNIVNLENHKQIDAKKCSGTTIEEQIGSLDHRCSVPESNLGPYLQKLVAANFTSSNVSIPAEAFTVNLPCVPSGFSNSSTCDGYGADGFDIDTNQSRSLQISEPSKELQKDLVKKLDIEDGLNHTDISSTSLRFSTISELHEALGPAFQNKGNLSDSEEHKFQAQSVKELEEIQSSQFTNEVGSDHLLEAVVANACQTCFNDRIEKSFSESGDPLSIRTMSEPASFSKLTINSVAYSIDQQSHLEEDCLRSSERSIGMSSSVISSAYPSSGAEPVGRSLETAKNSRKRSRPGESRRPRPRDRQLIQDRLKELRELVPNGSKCSIDSLLERAIKHMLFLESITKHADKLNLCSESKFRRSEVGMMGSSNAEQGSSWAVEVGSHLKVHSIMVENLSKNGQLLIEMLCEDCSHFLEIAEAMRSLGLTILKGATEVHSDKIWIIFIVEGQNNTSLHRMDILWSLVQILQLKAPSEA